MTALEQTYRKRFSAALQPVCSALFDFVREHLNHVPRIDRISVRPKSVESFLKKAEAQENGTDKYSDPLNQINDQLGARVVALYLDDVENVVGEVKKYFTSVEVKDLVPDSESEFGYFGKHFVLLLPKDVITGEVQEHLLPKFFELQVKTVFQHAWAEANHDIAYKPSQKLSKDQNRRVAFTSAQSWGADVIFNELQKSVTPA